MVRETSRKPRIIIEHSGCAHYTASRCPPPPSPLPPEAAGFAGRRVVVVGDLIADEYLYGKPARISREAPVLILRFTEREVRLGGAANAAHNVHALGAEAVAVGAPRDGHRRRRGRRRVPPGGHGDGRARPGPDRPTPVKTRIMAGGYQSTRQQVVRLDREPEAGAAPDAEARLIERLETEGAGGGRVPGVGLRLRHGDAPHLRASSASWRAPRALPVIVDSRYDLPRFRGATAATPNEPEVEALTGVVDRRRARAREGGPRRARAASTRGSSS